jgi:hypothetical protein
MKTLSFLSDFWQKAKLAVEDIQTELPKVAPETVLKPLGTSGKMWTIQYKDLGNNWSVTKLLQRHNGENNNLTLLTQKVKSVFEKSPDKVTEFLITTANKGWFVNNMDKEVRIVLTPNEISRLKLYIQENI